MQVSDYFANLRRLIADSPYVSSSQIEEDERTTHEGFIKMRIAFVDGSILSAREYVNTVNEPVKRYSYSFHYYKNNELLFRYDDTPHFPNLKSFPHHKHLAGGTVVESEAVFLSDVMKEIERALSLA